MPRRRRLEVLLFGAVSAILGAYEVWSVFVRETPAVTIQGYHLKAVDEFGQGARISQGFRMTASGLSAIDVQFSTDRPLNLLIRYELRELDERAGRELLIASQFVTIKSVDGIEWGRFPFPSVEMSDKRWYVLWFELMGAVPADESRERSAVATPDRTSRVAVMVSRENVFGGGALWINDRRQLGSLSTRAFSHRRTAYERFRADVAPSLPRALQNPVVEVALGVAYQAAMLTVIYALLIGSPRRSPAAGVSSD